MEPRPGPDRPGAARGRHGGRNAISKGEGVVDWAPWVRRRAMWQVRSRRRVVARRRPAAEVLEGRQLLAGDILAPQAVPLTTAPNLPNQAVAVATFATPGPDHPATSYTATIDWGDGTA